MELCLKSIAASLSPAVKSLRPTRAEFESFRTVLERYLSRIDENETEENHKTHLIDVFKSLFASDVVIEQQERIDFVIRGGGKDAPPVVLVETKTHRNRSEMISQTDLNRKAMHELILYYMRQRASNNIAIQRLIICSTFEFFIFDASQFERAFYNSSSFRRSYLDWAAGKTSDNTTDFFYRNIARPFIAASDGHLDATYFDLRKSEGERDLLAIYKALSPHHLVRDKVANDSNTLNKSFYDELLFIIGLQEVSKNSKKLIQRLPEKLRCTGSLLELTLARLEHSDGLNEESVILRYGSSRSERAFAIALELCLTWVNRLLFLKLLEAQLVRFHGGDSTYEFLNESAIGDFGELADLFFLVLALDTQERPDLVKRHGRIPYLNSSLFERTPLEQIVDISMLANREGIRPFPKSSLRNDRGAKLTSSLPTLSYLFRFLAAYDFGSEAGGGIRESNKSLISASVLGLIFEKINGYKDGAVFTPGLITMNMSRRVIEASVVDAFRKAFPHWVVNSIVDVRNSIVDRSARSILQLNSIVDGLKICDPAVGSGHFLVSCLNELIALKSRLGILADEHGERLTDYVVDVENDELIVVDRDTDKTFSYRVFENGVPAAVQKVQRTLFGEKRKLIENCLFGVDINQNSVRICQLRLWIELLKSAFYREEEPRKLETLPNIDINIKAGDSLLSRFALDSSLSTAFRSAGLTVRDYRTLVVDYKETRDKQLKRELERRISLAKQRFQAEALGHLSRSLNAEIARLRAQEAQLGLFVSEGDLDEVREKQLQKARENIAKLEQRLEIEARRNTYLGALEWRFEFPEILSSKGDYEGFDIIIGNPPYGVPVVGERRDLISKIVGKVPDFEIYYMFLNQARRLLRAGGRISFIIPNMMLSNVYAASYRLSLLDEWSEIEIDDLTDFRVFSDAVVHNIIYAAKKGVGPRGVLFRRTGNTETIADYLRQSQKLALPDDLVRANRNWGLCFRLEADVASAVAQIQADRPPLGTIFKQISQGLIAYDQYQGQDEETIKNRVHHKDHETATTSPWINGEDVRRYCMQWNGRDYIEYGSHLANPRQPKFFTEPRILVREITNPSIYAAYTTEVAYNDPAVINILASDDSDFPLAALEAILNSKLATFYHFNSSPKATKGAFPKILVDDIRRFPVPKPHENKEALRSLASLADQLRQEVMNPSDVAAMQRLEAQIDQAVYQLYDMKEAAIAIIERSFARSRSQVEVEQAQVPLTKTSPTY